MRLRGEIDTNRRRNGGKAANNPPQKFEMHLPFSEKAKIEGLLTLEEIINSDQLDFTPTDELIIRKIMVENIL